MSERFQALQNENDSKNTRLAIKEEFSNYRFGRDALAHTFRYLWVCEKWIELAKTLKRPIRILEIGCGDIYTARTFQASFRVTKKDIVELYTGIDIDDVSLARTKATMPQSFPIQLLWQDFTQTGLKNFEDNAFDLVVCMEVIEHVQPRFIPPLLQEIARVAERAIISTPNWSWGSGKLPEDHIKEWDFDELSAEMRKAGLEVTQHIGTFCNLAKIKKEIKGDHYLEKIYQTLEKTCPSELLSLTMARFMGEKAQNVLYHCQRIEK